MAFRTFSATLCATVLGVVVVSAAPPRETAQGDGTSYRIGFLSPYSAETARPWRAAFGRGLENLGYAEGKNVLIVERYAGGKSERLPDLAAQLVRVSPHVVVTHGDAAVRAVQRVDATIPVIFAVSADPIGAGLVDSLARPGGNVTGFSDLHSGLVAKRLQLLKELVPSASRIAVLFDADQKAAVLQLKDVRSAAPALGVVVIPVGIERVGDFDRAFSAITQERPAAVLVLGGPLMGTHEKTIAEFALRNRLPAIYTLRHMVEAGVLMSYGADFSDLYRRSATYVDRILQGTKAGDLPVEQPTKFELAINLKTAEALGLKIPQALLLRADHLIK